jgi:thiol-disulfide isomerase/thioredoxin
LLLLCCVIVMILDSYAQITAVKTPHSFPIFRDEKTIVKDTNGIIYPYQDWNRLIATGNYKLVQQTFTSHHPDYLLHRLTINEKKTGKIDFTSIKPAESECFKSGDTIKSFKAKDINNNSVDIDKLKGKVVVLNFWFTACRPCKQEMPELNRLVKKYKDDNVLFYAVGLDSKADIVNFLKVVPFLYTIIPDGKAIAHEYSLHSFPTHVVVDKDGKICFSTAGYSLGMAKYMGKAIDLAIHQKKE